MFLINVYVNVINVVYQRAINCSTISFFSEKLFLMFNFPFYAIKGIIVNYMICDEHLIVLSFLSIFKYNRLF